MADVERPSDERPSDERPRKRRGRKWLYALLAVLVVLGVAFVAGMWSADRGERAVESVAEPYTEAYAGLDTTKDVPVLLPLYADDAVLRDAATDRTHRGAAEIEDALNGLLATPDFDLTVDGTRVGDDWALVSWTADGTKPELGRVTQVEGVTVLVIADGMIERETWYYDPTKAPF